MNDNLKIIAGGEPYFSESLTEFLEMQARGELRGLAIVALKGDDIHTDYVKVAGTSVAELLGAVSVLQQELIERMREK